MWSTPAPTASSPSAAHLPFAYSAWDPYLSLSRPSITLRAGMIPGRGYMFTLTDCEGRTVTTPTVPVEEIYRALCGEHVSIRNGCFGADFLSAEGVIEITGGPLAGKRISGVFAPEVLRAAINGAFES